MADLIDTTEMYLRTVYELDEEGIVPLRARIAERLGHSGPTVSQTVGKLERDGWLLVGDDRQVVMTQAGRHRGEVVMRKHRLAECMLTELIGLEWADAHEEACRWEHVMSDQVVRRLVAILGDPSESPYGNPIPGRAQTRDFNDGVIRLDRAVMPGQQGVYQLARFSEVFQGDRQLLSQLAGIEARPGKQVDLTADAAGWLVRTPAGSVQLSRAAGRGVYLVQ
ncbi:MAG: metal-dependent transcriptional regulator [Bifidobacteriaceae bacterium]|nr:metal-dependent transcriptional regulator [Bifidobacteriaceae bacterium]